MPEWKDQIRNRPADLNLDPMREAEIVEELAQHLKDRYEELVGHGVTEENAWREAIELLSDSDLLARELRRVERTVAKPIVLGTPRRTIMGDVWLDLRYSFSRGARWLSISGRLTPGVSIAQAEANLSSIEKQLADAYPDKIQESEEGNVRGWGVKLVPAGSFPPRIQAGDARGSDDGPAV